jgi:hypothetical protein
MRAKILVALSLLLSPTLLLAQESSDSVIKWNQIVGLITAPGINNAVAGISSGAGPWSVHDGRARVDLENGQVTFEVRGLVLNGTNSSGTPATIGTVTGTVVCNPGTSDQVIRDTAEVKLTQQGDAHFRGAVYGIPVRCANPLFLVRIGPSFPVAGAVGKWLATGAIRTAGDGD